MLKNIKGQHQPFVGSDMKQFFSSPAPATILSQFVIDKDLRRGPRVNISTEFGGNWWCHIEAFGREDEDQLELFRRLGQVPEVGFWAGLRQLLGLVVHNGHSIVYTGI